MTQQSMFDRIVEMAKTPPIPDGEEETYNAGYHDGHVAFARELCKIIGVKVIEDETFWDEEELDDEA